MPASFPFKEEKSALFGTIRRPIAQVSFRHTTKDIWQPITMIVDTGADYTLLPRFLASPLGITFSDDCKVISTQGVGGNSKVYILHNNIRAKLGAYERYVPLGFLDNDYIPPLLGRQDFFETFKVVFEKYRVYFS